MKPWSLMNSRPLTGGNSCKCTWLIGLTSASHMGAPSFKLHWVELTASLAQLAEHALRKRMVVGSIPTGGFKSLSRARLDLAWTVSLSASTDTTNALRQFSRWSNAPQGATWPNVSQTLPPAILSFRRSRNE